MNVCKKVSGYLKIKASRQNGTLFYFTKTNYCNIVLQQ